MSQLLALPDVVLKKLVESALIEDLGERGDITSQAVIDDAATVELNIVARESGVICGLQLVQLAFKTIDKNIQINFFVKDGDKIEAQTVLARVSGRAKAILTAERTALNFLIYLSGIATKTNNIVLSIQDYPTKITCTRKTIPNHRILQKYAVRCGGAINHRMNLSEAILIKDNHIAIAGDISKAIKKVQQVAHMLPIEVEVDNLQQLKLVLMQQQPVDMVLLDNMDTASLKEAVELCKGKVKTEASGGITENKVIEVAKTGVDFIAIGALTHSFNSLDIGLDYLDNSLAGKHFFSRWFDLLKAKNS